MACLYHYNGVHFHFMKILMCYNMDLKLIDGINAYVLHIIFVTKIACILKINS